MTDLSITPSTHSVTPPLFIQQSFHPYILPTTCPSITNYHPLSLSSTHPLVISVINSSFHSLIHQNNLIKFPNINLPIHIHLVISKCFLLSGNSICVGILMYRCKLLYMCIYMSRKPSGIRKTEVVSTFQGLLYGILSVSPSTILGIYPVIYPVPGIYPVRNSL